MAMGTLGHGMAREYGVEPKRRKTRHYQVATVSSTMVLADTGLNVLRLPRSC